MSFSRFLFDNTYNLIQVIIMLKIVSGKIIIRVCNDDLGIIIDNFGILRDEEKKFRFDVQNICFICGYDRFLLLS